MHFFHFRPLYNSSCLAASSLQLGWTWRVLVCPDQYGETCEISCSSLYPEPICICKHIDSTIYMLCIPTNHLVCIFLCSSWTYTVLCCHRCMCQNPISMPVWVFGFTLQHLTFQVLCFLLYIKFLIWSCGNQNSMLMNYHCSRAFWDKRISQEVSGDALGDVHFY